MEPEEIREAIKDWRETAKEFRLVGYLSAAMCCETHADEFEKVLEEGNEKRTVKAQ